MVNESSTAAGVFKSQETWRRGVRAWLRGVDGDTGIVVLQGVQVGWS